MEEIDGKNVSVERKDCEIESIKVHNDGSRRYDRADGYYLNAKDLMVNILKFSSKEDKLQFLRYLVAQQEFSEVLEEAAQGLNDEEWYGFSDDPCGGYNSGDKLRSYLSRFAGDAALKTIEELSSCVNGLREGFLKQEKAIETLKSQWPDGFKKYMPEIRIRSYSSYVDSYIPKKLIELQEQSATKQ